MNKKQIRRTKSAFRLVAEPLLIAIGLALMIRTVFLRIYSIPSASMSPTLRAGDQILVTPYRIPFAASPERGDVIVFHAPGAGDELMVKRIVALPGDLIDTVAGKVRVGGHAIAEPYVAAGELTGGVAPQIIPADSVFVMGDHRADSLDSRNWGVLPSSLIAGRARLVLWSSGDGVSRATAHASAMDHSASPTTHAVRTGRFFLTIR